MFDDAKTPTMDLRTLARVEELRADLRAMVEAHELALPLLLGTPAHEIVRKQLDVLLFADNAIQIVYDD